MKSPISMYSKFHIEISSLWLVRSVLLSQFHHSIQKIRPRQIVPWTCPTSAKIGSAWQMNLMMRTNTFHLKILVQQLFIVHCSIWYLFFRYMSHFQSPLHQFCPCLCQGLTVEGADNATHTTSTTHAYTITITITLIWSILSQLHCLIRLKTNQL